VGSGIWGTILANLVGGCIFFFVDRKIFNNQKVDKITEYET